jgi:opacity protein-like surface antigen
MLKRVSRSAVLTAAALLLSAGGLQAQSHFGWKANLGYSTAGGDIGKLLDDGWAGELNGFYQTNGGIRIGLGTTAISYTMEEPLQSDSWTRISAFALGSYVFRLQSPFKPYIQGRVGYIRLTPDKRDEAGEKLPFVDRSDGLELGLVGGSEYMLGDKWGLDLSLKYSYLSVSDMLTADPDLPPGLTIENGHTWTIRLGMVMHF